MTDDLPAQTKFQWLARFGFVMRGLLYIVIAWLVIVNGRTEDLTGAMAYLGHGAGRGLLVFLAAGMAGYGAWRLCDAAFGMDSGRHHGKAWRKRIAAAGSGTIYLYLAWKACRFMLGYYAETTSVHQNAATALHLPAGDIALGIAAAVLAGAGVVQFYKAASCSFLDDLSEAASEPFARWVGRIGYTARGIIFLTVGWLLAKAALSHRAADAGGLEQALDALRGPLQFPIAAGLAFFGAYSIIEARYRTIHHPPTQQIKRKVAAAVDA
ncbi:DUF1206 domain-containing protein [Sphingomonas flavescens]|uniref:DUF1206 domain-containing protein n=1 Tax=Sphingomonas flavescens TaxID=3132797 RepID=UPI00280383BA|nr:DUF1206 domain-containing protein [Sphingomonas limnosediminicola]